MLHWRALTAPVHCRNSAARLSRIQLPPSLLRGLLTSARVASCLILMLHPAAYHIRPQATDTQTSPLQVATHASALPLSSVGLCEPCPPCCQCVVFLLTVQPVFPLTRQAILPLRGKILNIEKCASEKIYQNNELQALISALGLGIKVRSSTERARAGIVRNCRLPSDYEHRYTIVHCAWC